MKSSFVLCVVWTGDECDSMGKDEELKNPTGELGRQKKTGQKFDLLDGK